MQPPFSIPADFKKLDLSGICDCHTHIFPPAEQFPFAAKRNYTQAFQLFLLNKMPALRLSFLIAPMRSSMVRSLKLEVVLSFSMTPMCVRHI